MKSRTRKIVALPKLPTSSQLKKTLATSKVGKLADMLVKDYRANTDDGRKIISALLNGSLDLETGKQVVRANGNLIRGTSAMRAGMNADQKAALAQRILAERIVNNDNKLAPGASKLETMLAVEKALQNKSFAPVQRLARKYEAANLAAAQAV